MMFTVDWLNIMLGKACIQINIGHGKYRLTLRFMTGSVHRNSNDI